MGYLFLVLSKGLNNVEGMAIKAYNKKHSDGGFLFIAFVSLFAALFFVGLYFIADVNKGDFTLAVLPYAIGSGLCYCAASIAAFYALRFGPYALTRFIKELSIILTSIYGIIVFKDYTSTMSYVGFTLLVFSIAMLSGNVNAKAGKEEISKEEKKLRKKRTMLWIIMLVIDLLCGAAYSIITKSQQLVFKNTVNNEYKIIAFGVSAVVLFVIGFAMAGKRGGRVLKTSFPYAGLSGLANGANNLVDMEVNNRLLFSVKAPVGSFVGTAITFAIGFFVYKERFKPRQIIGIILKCVAVILISLGGIAR